MLHASNGGKIISTTHQSHSRFFLPGFGPVCLRLTAIGGWYTKARSAADRAECVTGQTAVYRYELHIAALDDENDRRTVYIVLDNSSGFSGTHFWHWASIELPLDQLNADTITQEQRDKGYDRGTLYWSLIQEAQRCSRLCIGAHIGDMFRLEKCHLDVLKGIHSDLYHGLYPLLSHSSDDKETRDYIDNLFKTFPRFLECWVKAQKWTDYLSLLIRERQKAAEANPGRRGRVYLLRSDSGKWKIGKSVDPSNRLKTFSVKLPFEVEFEHLIATENMAATEKALHARFAHRHVKGEWYDLTEDDINEIKKIDWM